MYVHPIILFSPQPSDFHPCPRTDPSDTVPCHPYHLTPILSAVWRGGAGLIFPFTLALARLAMWVPGQFSLLLCLGHSARAVVCIPKAGDLGAVMSFGSRETSHRVSGTCSCVILRKPLGHCDVWGCFPLWSAAGSARPPETLATGLCQCTPAAFEMLASVWAPMAPQSWRGPSSSQASPCPMGASRVLQPGQASAVL